MNDNEPDKIKKAVEGLTDYFVLNNISVRNGICAMLEMSMSSFLIADLPKESVLEMFSNMYDDMKKNMDKIREET